MVWIEINTGGRPDLHLIQNIAFTAQRCLDEILQPTVLPYATYAAAVVKEQFRFMNENSHPHRANIVNKWLKELGIERMV